MFFIFGMPRSGTTLFAQCLNAHSQIVVPDETDFIIPMAFIFDRVRDEAVGRDLIGKLIVNTASFRRSIGQYLNTETVYDVVGACEYSTAALLDALYDEIAKAGGAKLAGDKSPNDLNFLRMLVKTDGLSGNKKIIHLVRDVRDVMVSVNKTGWVSDLDLYFPRFWSNQNLYLNAIRGHDDSTYLLIRYEDLVSTPEYEFERTCRFLDLEFQPEMLSPEKRDRRHMGQGVHANLYKPISNASVGKYKSVLDASTLANYENQAREAMLAFGYLPE